MNASAQILSMNEVYQRLFQDDLVGARDAATTSSSPYHQVSLGLISFLEGAVGHQTIDLKEAIHLLSKGEDLTNARCAEKDTTVEEALACRVLVADALASQGGEAEYGQACTSADLLILQPWFTSSWGHT